MAAAAQHMNFSQFVNVYKNSKTKEEEAIAILDIIEEIKTAQTEQREDIHQQIVKDIHIEDLATRLDIARLEKDIEKLHLEMEKLRLEVQLQITQEVSRAKWQVIGTVFVAMIIPIILSHFGI